MKKLIIPFFLGILISTLGLTAYNAIAPDQDAIGGGIGTLNQLSQWRNDGTNITQNVASTALKLTGLESSGDCLVTDSSGIVTSAACGSGAGDSISINTVAVVDPNFVSTGQVSFTDTTNTVTANITDNSVLEIDLKAVDAATDEDILTYEATTGDFEWHTPAQLITAGTAIDWAGTTLNVDVTGTWSGLAGTASALAANGANCSAGSYPLGVDVAGAVESCTDASTEIDSIVATHAGVGNAHQALVTVSGTPDYITLSGQALTRTKLDISDDTNFVAGTGLTLSTNTVNVDASQTQITAIGTIATGVWQGTAINQTYLVGQSGTNTGDEETASLTVSGISELATAAEITTGTDTGRTMTPDAFAGSDFGKRSTSVIVLEAATAITVANGLATFPIPDGVGGMNLIGVHAYVNTAGITGTQSLQIHNLTQAADMLSTLITIDTTETTSRTAATAPVIDTANDDVADGDIIRIDSDAIHSGTAALGLMIELVFQLP